MGQSVHNWECKNNRKLDAQESLAILCEKEENRLTQCTGNIQSNLLRELTAT